MKNKINYSIITLILNSIVFVAQANEIKLAQGIVDITAPKGLVKINSYNTNFRNFDKINYDRAIGNDINAIKTKTIKPKLKLPINLQDLSVQAGGVRIIGSGGDAVVCDLGNGLKVYEILDVYEGQIINSAKSNYSGLSGNEFDRARQLAQRLSHLGPLFSEEIINKGVDVIEKNGLEFIDAGISDVGDSRHEFEPKSSDCKLEQLAVQSLEQLSYKRNYYISEPVWQKLNQNQKATIILHEAIFGLYLEGYQFSNQLHEILSSGDETLRNKALSFANSVGVRKLVWLLVSNEITKLNNYDYLLFLLNNGMGSRGEVHHLQGVPFTDKRFVKMSHNWRGNVGHDWRGRVEFTFDIQGNLNKVIQDPKVRSLPKPRSIYIDLQPGKWGYSEDYIYLSNKNTIDRVFCNDTMVPVGMASTVFGGSKNPLDIASNYLDNLFLFSEMQSLKYKKQLNDIYKSIRWKNDIRILNMNRGETASAGGCLIENIFAVDSVVTSDIPLNSSGELVSISQLNYVIGDQELWNKLPVEEQALALTQLVLMFNIQPDPITFKETYGFNFKKRVGAKSFTDLDSLALRWTMLLSSPDFSKITDQDYIDFAMENNLEFYWDTLKVDLNYNSTRIPGLSILASALKRYGEQHNYQFSSVGDLISIGAKYNSGIVGLVLSPDPKFNLRKAAGFQKSNKVLDDTIISLYDGCLRMNNNQVFSDPQLSFSVEKTHIVGFYKRICIE